MSKSKRRKIVVEGIACQWQVTSDQVHVWHPTLGRKAWVRDFSDAWDDWEASGTPATPRDVADFIYRAFLGREPPPRPAVTAIYPRPERMLVPKPIPTQPEVYLLVKRSYWFNEDDWLRTEDHVVASFTDPVMAKVQADRLNPWYAPRLAEMLRQPISWEVFHTKFRNETLSTPSDRFALWHAVAVPNYGSREVDRWAA